MSRCLLSRAGEARAGKLFPLAGVAVPVLLALAAMEHLHTASFIGLWWWYPVGVEGSVKRILDEGILGGTRAAGQGLAAAAMASLVAKLALVGQELLIVNHFGTGSQTEAYFVAFSVFSFLVNVLATSLTMAVVPAYVHASSEGGPQAAADVLSSSSLVVVALISAVAVAVGASGRMLIPLLAPGFDAARIDLSLTLLKLLLPSAVLAGVCAVWASALIAVGRAGLALMLPGLPAIVTLVGLAATGFRGGLIAVGFLMLGGYILQVVSTIWLAHHLIRNPRGRWIGIRTTWANVGREYWPMTAGAAVMSGTVLVDQAVVSLLGSGSVAVLGLAQRVAGLFQTVLGSSIGAVVFSRFARAATDRRWPSLKRSVGRWSLSMGGASLFLSVAIFALAEPLVSVAFQRGAFTRADTRAVAGVLRWYAVALPFFLVGMVLPRAIAALRANRILLAAAAGSFVLNIALDLVLSRAMGVGGIALATALVYLVSDVALFSWLWWRLGVQEHAEP